MLLTHLFLARVSIRVSIPTEIHYYSSLHTLPTPRHTQMSFSNSSTPACKFFPLLHPDTLLFFLSYTLLQLFLQPPTHTHTSLTHSRTPRNTSSHSSTHIHTLFCTLLHPQRHDFTPIHSHTSSADFPSMPTHHSKPTHLPNTPAHPSTHLPSLYASKHIFPASHVLRVTSFLAHTHTHTDKRAYLPSTSTQVRTLPCRGRSGCVECIIV